MPPADARIEAASSGAAPNRAGDADSCIGTEAAVDAAASHAGAAEAVTRAMSRAATTSADAGTDSDRPTSRAGASAVGGPPERPRRADARRNRDLLLAAAKDVFTERGVDAPLDDIARRAGVGNATMYRHFPTRSDLIVAVYADEVADLCARGEELAATQGPSAALFSWLAEFIAHVASKKELALAIADDRADTRSTLFGQWHAAMHQTAAVLLTRAQQAAVIRADLDVAELLSLANGIALSGAPPARLDRLLTLIREGVEAKPGSTS